MKLHLKCSHIETIFKMNDAYVDLCDDCFMNVEIEDYSKDDLECNYQTETIRGLE